MPVSGECSPAIPRAWGSSCSMPAASMPAQAGHAVGLAAALELVQAVQLGGVGRDDHLAAALVRDAPLLAVLVHLARALDAQAGLERAGRVVDAGVDHAGVVAGLMRADLGLALEHAHRRARVAPRSARAPPPGPRSRRPPPPGRNARAPAGAVAGARHPVQATLPARRDRPARWQRPRSPGRPRTGVRRRHRRACAPWPSGVR